MMNLSPLRKHYNRRLHGILDSSQYPLETKYDIKELQQRVDNEDGGMKTFANRLLHDDEYDMQPKPNDIECLDDGLETFAKLLLHNNEYDISSNPSGSPKLATPSPHTSPEEARHRNHHLKDNFDPLSRKTSRRSSKSAHSHTLPPPKRYNHPKREHRFHHFGHPVDIKLDATGLTKSTSAPIGTLSSTSPLLLTPPRNQYDVDDGKGQRLGRLSESHIDRRIGKLYSDFFGDDAARQKRLSDLELHIPIL